MLGNFDTSPYGQAILDILQPQPNFHSWEQLFGVTSDFWKRRNGSDHILVFSEPLHGLWHPKSRRGNYHFVHSQKQLEPPISISVELSTTFVQMYPYCARKNILLPYPNTDGRWFNGQLDREALKDNSTVIPPEAQLDAERELALQSRRNDNNDNSNIMEFRNKCKPLAQYFKSGNHGTCTAHRMALAADQGCTVAGKTIKRFKMHFSRGFRLSTFCPCPGGDSPSAKRMFDALHGGCIPIVLSEDYVWPLTPEFDRTGTSEATVSSKLLNPAEFSIRLNASDYINPRHDANTCKLLEEGSTDHGLQSIVEKLSPEEIRKLREGVAKASDVYAWYRRRPDLPDNPLVEGILPDGGTAHALVAALAERGNGVLWPACQAELAQLPAHQPEPRVFKC